ncbi:MAG: hypothetical protein ACD_15C00175G0003 [uncultured bacterium]|nr:MAG: hypothetical protein ACD_15C00175G0003 [uncultured bacterium]
MREPDDPRTKELIAQFLVLGEKIEELVCLNEAIMEKGMQLQEMANVEGEPDKEAISEVLEELSQLIIHCKSALSGENPQKSSELPE